MFASSLPRTVTKRAINSKNEQTEHRGRVTNSAGTIGRRRDGQEGREKDREKYLGLGGSSPIDREEIRAACRGEWRPTETGMMIVDFARGAKNRGRLKLPRWRTTAQLSPASSQSAFVCARVRGPSVQTWARLRSPARPREPEAWRDHLLG